MRMQECLHFLGLLSPVRKPRRVPFGACQVSDSVLQRRTLLHGRDPGRFPTQENEFRARLVSSSINNSTGGGEAKEQSSLRGSHPRITVARLQGQRAIPKVYLGPLPPFHPQIRETDRPLALNDMPLTAMKMKLQSLLGRQNCATTSSRPPLSTSLIQDISLLAKTAFDSDTLPNLLSSFRTSVDRITRCPKATPLARSNVL